jgi:hypothetical protein
MTFSGLSEAVETTLRLLIECLLAENVIYSHRASGLNYLSASLFFSFLFKYGPSFLVKYKLQHATSFDQSCVVPMDTGAIS